MFHFPVLCFVSPIVSHAGILYNTLATLNDDCTIDREPPPFSVATDNQWGGFRFIGDVMKKEYGLPLTMWMVVFAFVFSAIGVLFQAFVMAKIVGWYSLPELSYVQCVGILLISSFFKSMNSEEEKDILISTAKIVLGAFISPLFILLFAYIIKLFV